MITTTTIKEPIVAGRSYYEIIPSTLGGFVMVITSYGKVISSGCYSSVFAAKKYVQDNKAIF